MTASGRHAAMASNAAMTPAGWRGLIRDYSVREALSRAAEQADAASATLRLRDYTNTVTISETTKLGRPSHLSSGYTADDARRLTRALPASSSPIRAD
jgi:hypothetical protein